MHYTELKEQGKTPGNTGHKGIRGWPALERPRERLLTMGPETLSDAQLLAILLRTGRVRKSAVALALEVLTEAGGLGGLGRLSARELCSLSGIGPAKAAQLKAAVEIGKRISATPLLLGEKVSCSREVYEHFLPHVRDLKKEVFRAVLLDRKNCLIKVETISEGSLTVSLVHPREAFLPAVKNSAASVIFLHNHPSGDPTPSREDLELTRRLVEAGRILGVPVLDHIIVGDRNRTYLSFADKGLL